MRPHGRTEKGQFAPGSSGNPYARLGQQEASQQLRLAVNDVIKTKGEHKGKKKIRRICEKITEAALEGEPWACGMVFDRLDGKPLQFIDQTMTIEAGDVFIDLLKAINERRGKVIEHEPAERPAADGGMAEVGD